MLRLAAILITITVYPSGLKPGDPALQALKDAQQRIDTADDLRAHLPTIPRATATRSCCLIARTVTILSANVYRMNLLNRIRAAFRDRRKVEAPDYLDDRDKIMDDFIQYVLHLNPALVLLTEHSDLTEFPESYPVYAVRIYRLYEVDITPFMSTNVFSILDAIASRCGVS